MSRIFFDLGNTRIKYWTDTEPSLNGVFRYDEADSALKLVKIQEDSPDHAVIASVVRDHRESTFIHELREWGFRRIEYCQVMASALGVRCGYADTNRLGIDRWLAVLAGWEQVRGACVVVDLGTAATLDFIDQQGQHLGGFILPGLRLAVTGLLNGTSNIKVDFDKLARADLSPGTNSTDAVYHGALFAMVAVVESAIGRLRERSPEAKLLITGGDAALVGSQLGCHHQIVENLVFIGMRLLADAKLVVEAPAQDNK